MYNVKFKKRNIDFNPLHAVFFFFFAERHNCVCVCACVRWCIYVYRYVHISLYGPVDVEIELFKDFSIGF